MGRLIRHLILAACVLLPGIAGAQAIQNSATGELNGRTLDLSQATVVLNRSTVVSAVISTVTVDPPIVVANGISSSTITVTLFDYNNQPLAGRVVSIATSRGVGSGGRSASRNLAIRCS